MQIWQAIVTRSQVNDRYYDEERLPHLPWAWPSGTWLQARREYLRKRQLTQRGKTS